MVYYPALRIWEVCGRIPYRSVSIVRVPQLRISSAVIEELMCTESADMQSG
jgi:hypothetical protein